MSPERHPDRHQYMRAASTSHNDRNEAAGQRPERSTGQKHDTDKRLDAVRDPRERPQWGRDEEIF